MRKRTWAIIGGVAAALVITVAVGGFLLLSGDAPAEANLADAVASVGSTAGPDGTSAPGGTLAGTYTLATTGESFVGYRVNEKLTTIGDFTAVGRTSALTASLSFDGSAITSARVEADLTKLQSDSNFRDMALRRQALQIDQYPTATFVLTQPIAIPDVPEENTAITATAIGDLTLHGVTRSVTLALQGQRTNGMLVVVGSTEIAFADYAIATPTAPVVASVEDRGTLELQLVLQREA